MGDKKLILAISVVITVVICLFSFVMLSSTNKRSEDRVNLDKSKLIYDRAVDLLNSGDKEKAIGSLVLIPGHYPDSEYAEKSLRKLAAIYVGNKDEDKAKYYYSRLLKDFPEVKDKEKIRSIIDDLNVKMIQSSKITADSIEYVIQAGDTLYGLANKFKTTVELIKNMNGLTKDTIWVGQKLKINIAKFSILVDKASNILILKKDGEPFKTYTVATGRNNSTPVGVFTIVDKMVKPPWTKPGVGVIMPDSEEYELGERWMPFSIKGYGIHGTNKDSSIGSQATAGCVRMFNDDVIELYNIVPRGTEVKIVNNLEQKNVNTKEVPVVIGVNDAGTNKDAKGEVDLPLTGSI